jgi:hypothetical protein
MHFCLEREKRKKEETITGKKPSIKHHHVPHHKEKSEVTLSTTW